MFDGIASFGLSLIGWGATFNFLFWLTALGVAGYFVWSKWADIMRLYGEAKAYYDHVPEIITDVQTKVQGAIDQGEQLLAQVRDALPALQDSIQRIPEVLDQVNAATQEIQGLSGQLAQVSALQAQLDAIQAQLSEISAKLPSTG